MNEGELTGVLEGAGRLRFASLKYGTLTPPEIYALSSSLRAACQRGSCGSPANRRMPGTSRRPGREKAANGSDQRAVWTLQTSLEREFGGRGADYEQELFWHFVRTAPRWQPSHLVPRDDDAAAWLGLIQHYGGPTRFLDVTRSPYIALFFAVEPPGDDDRAVWAIEHVWCAAECARIMAEAEGTSFDRTFGRTMAAQEQLVHSLVHRRPHRDPLFASFKPFTGIFPVDPWKPDVRQSAQQAMFLCAANPALSFIENLAAHTQPATQILYRFILPAGLRQEA